MEKEKVHIVKPKKDLTGQVFGNLKVIGLSDRTGSRGKRRVPLWTCECKCGVITYKATDTLTNKDLSSCADCAAKYATAEMRKRAGFQDGTQISRIKNISSESANLSGVRGVYFEKGRYRARLKFKGHLYNFGSYETLADAIKARQKGEEEIFGHYLEALGETDGSSKKPSLNDQIASASLRRGDISVAPAPPVRVAAR